MGRNTGALCLLHGASAVQPAVVFPIPQPAAMESLAAAPRRAKRRKPEAPKSPEQEGEANISPRPATGAPDSSPPGTGAAGGEEDDGVDRVSSLPDAILGEVISLLPSKDAACTQILATRWRHLWRFAPLKLDGTYPLAINVVSRILSSHQGLCRRFCFFQEHLRDSPATVDEWLRSPVLNNLQEIECSAMDFVQLPMPPVPASSFRFSSTLCVAIFSQCQLSDDIITQALQFPRLKKLALQRVIISEDFLQSIIAASPVLECLLLRRIFGLLCVRIISASVTSIGVRAGYHQTLPCLEEFIVEDAPCLKRILYVQSPVLKGTRVSVISAPNMETLGCLSYRDSFSRLALGSMTIEPCCIKEFRVINWTMPACTVKILAVDLLNLSLDVIIDLMRCFSCLEKLYIQAHKRGDKNLWRRKHRNLIKYLDIRLKTVVLNNSYCGIMSQVNFATFFVMNAKMLESMTFQCENYTVTDRFVAEQHEVLQLEKRASRCARFYFIDKRCDNDFMHINHVHDLSKTNPFECEGTGRCIHIL